MGSGMYDAWIWSNTDSPGETGLAGGQAKVLCTVFAEGTHGKAELVAGLSACGCMKLCSVVGIKLADFILPEGRGRLATGLSGGGPDAWDLTACGNAELRSPEGMPGRGHEAWDMTSLGAEGF